MNDKLKRERQEKCVHVLSHVEALPAAAINDDTITETKRWIEVRVHYSGQRSAKCLKCEAWIPIDVEVRDD